MLTFHQLETIAILLNWTVEEVEAAIAQLNAEFMTPDVEYLCDPEVLAEIDPDGDQACGFYCRLSASGYLDCTHWDGPYLTEEQAVAALLENYAGL